MKYTVFTVMTPDLKPEELTASLKEYGYDGVEWRCTHVPEELKKEPPTFWGYNQCTIDPGASDQELEQWLQLTKKYGLEITAVTPYLNACNLEETEKILDIARKLGASCIRLGTPQYNRTESYHALFDKGVRYLRESESLCKQYGVKGLIETHHGLISSSASLAYRLVSELDPDYIGVLYDPGNMVHEGYENYRMGMELLGPYLAHVHVKNAAMRTGERRADGQLQWETSWTFVSEGIVDWRQVIQDLKAVGYNGTIGFEDFSGTYETKEALKRNIAYIKGIVDEIYEN